MDCEQFDRLISSYLSGEDLDDQLKQEFRDHYLSCDKCWKNYEDQMDLMDHLEEKTVSGILGYEPEVDRVEELLEYAQTLGDQGNLFEANECLGEALKLKPGDDQIKKKIKEISEMKRDHLKDETSLKSKPLVEKLSELKSRMNFSFSVSPLFAVRDEHQEEEGFKVGEEIVLEFEPSREKDGYLTIIHYDEQENVQLVFPKNIDDISLLRADDDKSIRMLATEPRGKHYLKAILTSKPIIEQGTPGFLSDFSGISLIEHLLESLYNLHDGEWMEAVTEFEIK